MQTLDYPRAETIRIRCSACKEPQYPPARYAGKRVRCKSCSAGLEVPRIDDAPKSVRFRCPDCGFEKVAPATLVGRKVRCPACDSAVRVASSPPARTESAQPGRPAERAERPVLVDRGEPSPYAPPQEVALDPLNTEAEPTANAAPELLKIWGTLIAGTNALMLPYAALMLFVGVRGGLRTGSATTLLAGVLPVAVAIVCVRLGIGLYRGQRQAVIGVGLLGVLVLPCLLYVAVTKQPLMGLIVLGQASALIVPAVWVGAKNYTRLPN